MKICLLEPYHTGSHATWAEEYARVSSHDITLLTLSGRHWKWRMHGGAVALAREYLARQCQADLLLASDMLDLTTFLALTRQQTAHIPSALYFHENQLTYPWSPGDADPGQQRDAHYAFINYSSALAADRVFFNSRYHHDVFYRQLPDFLSGFPDPVDADELARLRQKSGVLPLGLDLQRLAALRPEPCHAQRKCPLVLWNHRWEYDKNPEAFFEALYLLHEEGHAFEVAVLGESYRKCPAVFAEAREKLGRRIVHFGYVADFADYARWLWQADILPVTSRHDFFGASVVQAIYCGCTPLLPRRLAYPEHLPETFHAQYLYEDIKDFTARLREMITAPTAAEEALQAHVAHYDWQEQVRHYDCQLETLTSRQTC